MQIATQINPQIAPMSQPDSATTRRQQYSNDGYCLLPDFFRLADIEQIYDDMMALFAFQMRHLGIPQSNWRDPHGLRTNFLALFNIDREAYRGAARQSQLLPSIQHLTTSPMIVETLRSLGLDAPVVSTKPVCHYMTEALKIPGGYHKAPPHQEWRSMQGSLGGVVLWIPLVDMDEQSYAPECVPGSHKFGLLNTEPHVATPMVMDDRIHETDFVALHPKRGDLAIFSGFIVHRTGARGDDRVRVAMSLRYNNAAEPSYVGHAYPTLYKYDYQLELMFDNFTADHQVKGIFTDLAR